MSLRPLVLILPPNRFQTQGTPPCANPRAGRRLEPSMSARNGSAPYQGHQTERSRLHNTTTYCWKAGDRFGAHQRHTAFLDRLAKRLEHIRPEFGRLVEEEDSPVRQADLPRPEPRPPPIMPSSEGPMVRRAEPRPQLEAAPRLQHARQGIQRGDLHRVHLAKVGKEPGKAPNRHCLARAGGPEKKDVVAAGGRDLRPRLRRSWPLSSEKRRPRDRVGSAAQGSLGRGLGRRLPRRASRGEGRLVEPCRWDRRSPGEAPAPRPRCHRVRRSGSTPDARAAATAGSTPRTGRTVPSSLSSPRASTVRPGSGTLSAQGGAGYGNVGRVVIVTGGSSGIGLATAALLASNGARVVLAARDAENVKRAAESIPGTLGVPTDITREESIANPVAETLKEFGRIDIRINNAGQAPQGRGRIEDCNIEETPSKMPTSTFSVK